VLTQVGLQTFGDRDGANPCWSSHGVGNSRLCAQYSLAMHCVSRGMAVLNIFRPKFPRQMIINCLGRDGRRDGHPGYWPVSVRVSRRVYVYTGSRIRRPDQGNKRASGGPAEWRTPSKKSIC